MAFQQVFVQSRTTTYNSLMTTVTASEARASLPELLNRVANGEEITITRHGQPVAVMVRPDLLRSRRIDDLMAGARRIEELLVEARKRPLGSGPGISAESAEELIREIRADRDAGR